MALRSDARRDRAVAFPIVGVGASAGGLEAFTQLLGQLPADTGLAFVLIQHLDPTHPSLLGEALAKATAMPVSQAEHGMRVEPNHVYVIPPNADIAIVTAGSTCRRGRPTVASSHLPIDFFLRSLAAERGSHAIGVDPVGHRLGRHRRPARDQGGGRHHLRAGPAVGEVRGMPRSAIDAGVVDYCAGDPGARRRAGAPEPPPVRAPTPTSPPAADDSAALKQIFAVVRSAVGVDFSEFKPSTVRAPARAPDGAARASTTCTTT